MRLLSFSTVSNIYHQSHIERRHRWIWLSPGTTPMDLDRREQQHNVSASAEHTDKQVGISPPIGRRGTVMVFLRSVVASNSLRRRWECYVHQLRRRKGHHNRRNSVCVCVTRRRADFHVADTMATHSSNGGDGPHRSFQSSSRLLIPRITTPTEVMSQELSTSSPLFFCRSASYSHSDPYLC